MLEPIIGIEVHIELNSNSKVFSDSLNEFSKEPNTNVNLVDLGYPGTLPRLNKKVVDMALSAAIALNCKINKTMYFDRKNYFYPDLPKGYQITQNDTPIGYDGYVEINNNGNIKKIAIERIHIEEDTCKSIHTKVGTLLNANRAGIPLIEIVTKPVITSSKEAVLYLEKIREIMIFLGISDVKIEEGSMRCDANISLKEKGSNVLGNKTEVKNIGSISNVGLSIEYEIKRQTEKLSKGEKIITETRRFDNNKTVSMRVKEKGSDYRYFPEPDIPVIHISDEWIDTIKSKMPVFADTLKEKYKDLGISTNVINAIISRLDICQFLEDVIDEIDPVIGANILTSDILSYLNKNNITINQVSLTKDNFKKLINKIKKQTLSGKQAKELIHHLLSKETDIETLIKDLGMQMISDEKAITSIIDKVINANEESVNDYKQGKERALKYLIGQIMRESKGAVNPITVNELLIERINKN